MKTENKYCDRQRIRPAIEKNELNFVYNNTLIYKMISIDTNRIFNDDKYRILLRECSLISNMVTNLHKYPKILSANLTFNNKTSELYNLKDEVIQMLTEIFPLFEISIQQYGEHNELHEDEFNIIVSWENYNKSKQTKNSH
jgi:hypothetical protein